MRCESAGRVDLDSESSSRLICLRHQTHVSDIKVLGTSDEWLIQDFDLGRDVSGRWWMSMLGLMALDTQLELQVMCR